MNNKIRKLRNINIKYRKQELYVSLNSAYTLMKSGAGKNYEHMIMVREEPRAFGHDVTISSKNMEKLYKFMTKNKRYFMEEKK